jgi:hypothetical protein
MIACYLDDSGKESNPESRYVAMAGYAAHDSYWDSFQGEWVHMLLKHGIVQVHMRDLIPIKGIYEQLGWDIQKRDEVIADFIEVIKRNHLIGFGVVVDRDAWKTHVAPLVKNAPKAESNSHHFCFARMMRMLIDRIKRSGIDDFMAVTFDTDREFAAARFNLFSDIWNTDTEARQYLSSISFADVVKHPQLQAADMLAWESRKELIQKIGGDSTTRWKDLFSALPGKPLDYEGQLWDEDALKNTLLPGLGII